MILSALIASSWMIQIIWTLAVPTFLLAHKLGVNRKTVIKVSCSLGLVSFVLITLVVTNTLPGLNTIQAFIFFALLLATLAIIVAWSYECNFWTALFCATAGYTMQNMLSGLQTLITMLLNHRANSAVQGLEYLVIYYLIPIVFYTACYFIFIERIGKNDLTPVKDPAMLLMFLVVVFLIIGFDLVVKNISYAGIRFDLLIMLRLIHSSLCAFVLFAEYEILVARQSRNKKIEIERLLAERQKQYELNKQTIDAINIKCHDIRHQIRHLSDGNSQIDQSVLNDIAQEVKVYDSSVQTGNEALNTILTEKNFACSGENIVLACIADGALLNFMSPSDIYVFFGNALDNAIDAVKKIQDSERRSITLNVTQRGNMAVVNIENYFSDAPTFIDNSLVTSKDDHFNHGFGVRSMELIAKRYNGNIHVGVNEDVFYLNAFFPLPKQSN
mgnify:FL=1